MIFDEWFHKEYEPADLQIKQYAERKEGLHIHATVYLEDLKKAFEAGLHSDVHTDNSKVIAELKDEVHTWKKASELNSYKAHELGERANQLLKDKGNLIDENNELKKQIEKMKCCIVSSCEGCERLPKLYMELENV